MEQVIIDTDPAIGVPFRDIDDGFAIALALLSPELIVEGITVTHGNVDLRRALRSARRLLKAAEREDVPVLAGAAGRHDTANCKATDASRFIAEKLNAEPGAITLLTLGPLSNLAAVELTTPGTLRKSRRVVTMGGAVDCVGVVPPWFRAEFNFWKDVPATALFLESAGDLTLIPFDLTKKVIFGAPQMRVLREADTPLARYLAKHTELWYRLNRAVLMKGGFWPHDPLAAAYLLQPEIYETETVNLKIIEREGIRYGELERDPGGVPVRVAFDVEAHSFLNLLTSRITAR